MRKWLYLLGLVVFLTGCKTLKPGSGSLDPVYLSSKLQLVVPTRDGSLTIGGHMKMKSHERIQISLLMPILRSEVARIEITPDDILLIDRMNKRYVRATKAEVEQAILHKADYSRLEKLLIKASLPNAKSEILGKDLGIPSLQKAKLKLYDFSAREIAIIPTEVSSKYRQTSLEELMNMLSKIL